MLKVPHDPVALEEHFRDDDEGPVSNQGYMPYLNKFILEKVCFEPLPAYSVVRFAVSSGPHGRLLVSSLSSLGVKYHGINQKGKKE